MAFVNGNALSAEYNGTMWMGSARSFAQVGNNGGSLYRLKLTPDRLHIDTSADPRLADKVAGWSPNSAFRNRIANSVQSALVCHHRTTDFPVQHP